MVTAAICSIKSLTLSCLGGRLFLITSHTANALPLALRSRSELTQEPPLWHHRCFEELGVHPGYANFWKRPWLPGKKKQKSVKKNRKLQKEQMRKSPFRHSEYSKIINKTSLNHLPPTFRIASWKALRTTPSAAISCRG